ncbi:MAG: alpha/beta fold hydrolase [Planctomycetota bacterium]|jgi:pimeloyl-ACP methyl ester carboxylesterase
MSLDDSTRRTHRRVMACCVALGFGFFVAAPAEAADPVESNRTVQLEHRYTTQGEVRLHYVTTGQGTVILFLHGFPESWHLWRRQLETFGATHRVVAPDLRGYNLSDKPEDVRAYEMKHLVGDVRSLIDEVSPDRPVVLVAHDWGGAVAWAAARAMPDRIDRLVIVNAPHPATFLREIATNPAQRKASSYMNWFRRPGVEEQLLANNAQRLQRMVFGASPNPDVYSEADRADYIKAWLRPGAVTGGLNYYRAMSGGVPVTDEEADRWREAIEKDFNPIDHTVDVPTLVLWGMADTALLPGLLDGLDELVPDLRVRRHDEGTHWVIHEQPEWVNRHIRAFLSGE